MYVHVCGADVHVCGEDVHVCGEDVQFMYITILIINKSHPVLNSSDLDNNSFIHHEITCHGYDLEELHHPIDEGYLHIPTGGWSTIQGAGFVDQNILFGHM